MPLLAAVCLMSACGGDETDGTATEKRTARRMSPVDGPSLLRQAKGFQARACACPDVACAKRTLEAMDAFGRKHVATRVDAGPESEIKAAVSAALACIDGKLSAPSGAE